VVALELAGRRVGVWGLGVEGRATLAALRELDDVSVVCVDDAVVDDLGDVLLTSEGGLDEAERLRRRSQESGHLTAPK
jgi:UDP-N-acetylmuramoylalanine--D-glutamate ligase